MVIVMGEIGICLKGEVGQFSSLLPGIVQHPQFLKLAPTLGSVQCSNPHGNWRFHFFQKKNFLNLDYT
jgi:hypothetical protein